MDGGQADILGYPLRLHFSLGCAPLAGLMQIFLKILHFPKISFLGTDVRVTLQPYLPYPKAWALYRVYL